jgi:hypothetical protein
MPMLRFDDEITPLFALFSMLALHIAHCEKTFSEKAKSSIKSVI